VETSFASGTTEFLGINAREILQAIRAAVPRGLEVRLFFGIHHRGRPPKMEAVLGDALTWPELDGIDLHGPEDHAVEPWTREYWAAARHAGKYTKAHAGEFMGADFVRYVMDELNPHRIEHGVRAVEDAALVAKLARAGVGLDVCPISNHKLMPGITLATHPIRTLFDVGVKVTVSTDDPISFGNTLTDDYVALAEHRGFTRRELAQVARHGFELALLSDAQKAPRLAEVDAIINQT
jgi:adenosine deaminase